MASDEILLYYFFDARLELRNNAACLVRSLIYQLVQLDKDGKHGNHWWKTRFQFLWYMFIKILQDLKGCRAPCKGSFARMIGSLISLDTSRSPSLQQQVKADPIWVDGERDSTVALLLPIYARQEAKKAILAKDSFTPAWVRQLLQGRTRPRECDHRIFFDAAVYSTTSLKTMKALLELTGPQDINRERNEFSLSRARTHGKRAEVIQMLIDDYGYSISDFDGK
ncbi:unnamed protein product [Fusarium fujikuroi]|uniref:Uncharacterized protein n=1 Tax=Fusarium fujikuroi TaxID=5127 RepID=A0A9Q9RDH8_FUSFU|nr:unnamed protein product [Fusarium fujikuroi]